jgi:cytochrome P450
MPSRMKFAEISPWYSAKASSLLKVRSEVIFHSEIPQNSLEILTNAGETHRRQRRLMNPAFAPSNLKAMTPGFFALAYQVCHSSRCACSSERCLG